MKKYLVLLDTDRIHEYVFATNKLKEIRGASAILSELNNMKETEKLFDGFGETIFIGGGSGKVIFTDISKAIEFCDSLEKEYRIKTDGESSITTAIVPYDDSTEDKFKESIYRGEKELRKRKDSRYLRIQLLNNHYFKTCESSGILPAEFAIEGNKLISSANHKKREKAQKALFFNDFKGFIEKNKDKTNDLSEKIKNNSWNTLFEKFFEKLLPEYINSIGELSDGYVGLIYADGNRMGQKLQELPDKESYAEFSEKILIGIKDAIFESLTNNLVMGEYFPFEILLLGGDDILVLVPANRAIKTTIDFCDKFKDKTGVSISAGVIITHANYPMHQMIDYAEQLLKSEKKESNKNPEKEENYIDYMVIKGSIPSEVKYIRDNELTYHGEDGVKIRLFQKPYTTDGLRKLVDKIHKLKEEGKFPHSRLKQMYESLFRGKNQAILDYCLLLSRLDKDTSQKVIKEEFFRECDLFPWIRTEKGLETPFMDLIELYDYIE